MSFIVNLNPNESNVKQANKGRNKEIDRTVNLYDQVLNDIESKKEFDDVSSQFYEDENPIDSDKTNMSNFDYQAFLKHINDGMRQEDSEGMFVVDDDENERAVIDRLLEQRKKADDAVAQDDEYYNYYLANKDKFRSIEPLSDDVRNGVTMLDDRTMNVLNNVDDVLLGYDPKDDGSADYVGEEDSVPEAIYYMPFVGDKIYAGKVLKDAVSGKRVPGLLDVGFGLMGLSGLGYGAYRGIKSLRNARRASNVNGYLGGYPKSITGQVFDRNGNVVPWDNFRWADKPNYEKRFGGRTIYDTDGNVLKGWR